MIFINNIIVMLPKWQNMPFLQTQGRNTRQLNYRVVANKVPKIVEGIKIK